MHYYNEQWIQAVNGLWLPTQRPSHNDQVKQQAPLPVHPPAESEPKRDWLAYWRAQEQPWRTEPEIDEQRQQFLGRCYRDTKIRNEKSPLQDVEVKRADIEWLLVHQEAVGLDISRAKMEAVSFVGLLLWAADFTDAQLKGADFWRANLELANFHEAQLQSADFMEAQLASVSFWEANLEDVCFRGARLTGADFRGAQLTGADFRGAWLAGRQGVGPSVVDVQGWDRVNLSIIEWPQIRSLGDEAEAAKKRDNSGQKKKKTVRAHEYHAATRAYRQLATALEQQGLKEEAERFAYNAKVMQQTMLWHRIGARGRRFGQRWADLGTFLFLLMLSMLSGYGYRLGRTLFWYGAVLLTFMGVYLWIASGQPKPLEWGDALILSVSNMVGRGFFRQDITLSDPFASWSVLEGIIGVFMDVLLISTLTQRLFKK